MDKQLSANIRIVAHVLLGSLVGFFSACIFLMLYYFTTYTLPISDKMRFNNAFWSTFYIVIVIFAILFFRDIKAAIVSMMPEDEDEGDDEIE
jgi:hypothetical protein